MDPRDGGLQEKERRSLGEEKGGLLQAKEARGEVRKPKCQRRQ